MEIQLRTLLTSALDGGEFSAAHPVRFTSREKEPRTHWIGSCVGPRAGLDAVVKRKKFPAPAPAPAPVGNAVQNETRSTDFGIALSYEI